MSYCEDYLTNLTRLLGETEFTDSTGQRCPCAEGVDRLVAHSRDVRRTDGTQFFIGNGASAAFSSHMALDWSKNGRVRSQSFTDGVLQTALVNDLGGAQGFAAALEMYARPGDLLVAISSSGNSPNILEAIATARTLRVKVVTLSGLKPDNRSRGLGDLNAYVPGRTYGMVECAHQVLLHLWLDCFMGVTEWDRTEVQNMRAAEFHL